MTMITLWHLIIHGAGHVSYGVTHLSQLPNELLFTLPLLCHHVNCFVFISGYYGIRLSRKKLLSFISMTLFYSIASCVVYSLIQEGPLFYNIVRLDFFRILFPISNNTWWFVSDYFFLMLLSPAINSGLESLSKSYFEGILIVLFVFSVSGFACLCSQNVHLMTFIYIYLLGRYLQKYPLSFLKKHSAKIWIVSVLFLIMWQWMHLYVARIPGQNSNLIVPYNNPFVIIASISFFYMFEKMNIGNYPKANRLFSGVLSAYLITDGVLRNTINLWIIDNFGTNVALLAIIALLVVLLFSVCDIIRGIAMEPMNNWILKKIDSLASHYRYD